MPKPEYNFDLESATKHELEVLKSELETFFQSKLYQVYLQACHDTSQSLLDTVMGSTLRGVESLFTREAILGEAQGWKNMQELFTELLEDIKTQIQQRK